MRAGNGRGTLAVGGKNVNRAAGGGPNAADLELGIFLGC
jgi:hypothetical protein